MPAIDYGLKISLWYCNSNNVYYQEGESRVINLINLIWRSPALYHFQWKWQKMNNNLHHPYYFFKKKKYLLWKKSRFCGDVMDLPLSITAQATFIKYQAYSFDKKGKNSPITKKWQTFNAKRNYVQAYLWDDYAVEIQNEYAFPGKALQLMKGSTEVAWCSSSFLCLHDNKLCPWQTERIWKKLQHEYLQITRLSCTMQGLLLVFNNVGALKSSIFSR